VFCFGGTVIDVDSSQKMKNELRDKQRRIWEKLLDRSGKEGRFGLVLLIGFCLILAVPVVGLADDDGDEQLTFSLGDTWAISLFETGHLYDSYIADPIRPGFSLMRMSMMESDIPDAGNRRYNFMLGGQYGLFRLHNSDFPGREFQLDIYGAFLGQFDLDNSTDNIGWDGFYGVMLTWADRDGLSLKLAMQHDSSHVGDEYAERSGRRRINYTRQEIVYGVSYRFQEFYRVYTEAGYGYDLRNPDLQEPWRVKGGMEFEDRDRFLGGRLGYYAAADFNFSEERDWNADVTVQTGVVLPLRRSFRTVRFGPIYRSGRSILGEFFQHKEKWWGLCAWIDM